jgi:hypothetical protein
MRRIALGLIAAAAAAGQDSTRADGNPVDRFFEARWKELSIVPNRLSGDEEFLRRATLDLTGSLPEPAEVDRFVREPGAKKRAKKIDELIESEDFTDYWAERLAHVLIGPGERRRNAAAGPLTEYLKDRLQKKTPYARIVEELVTATGRSTETNTIAFASAFLYKDKTQKKNFAVQISKVFMGIQLQCAQCHDHPFDAWTKDDFFSVVASFGGTSARILDKDKKDEFEIVDNPRRANSFKPEGYKVALKPKFIDGTPIAGRNPREEFARKLVSPDNLQFGRATVNRVWSILTGQGFVEPVDDFGARHQPAFPELLDELAREFLRRDTDLRWLIRTIVTSRVYQLSSRRKEGAFNEQSRKYYAYALVRPMSPEQMLGSLISAQGLGESGGGARGLKARQQFYRQMAESAESSDSPAEYNASVQQIMRMLDMNSPMYRGTDPKGPGRLARLLRERLKPEEVIAQLYLATVSRRPADDELARCLKYWRDHGSNPAAYEDLFFVLLNTNEFFFNH